MMSKVDKLELLKVCRLVEAEFCRNSPILWGRGCNDRVVASSCWASYTDASYWVRHLSLAYIVYYIC